MGFWILFTQFMATISAMIVKFIIISVKVHNDLIENFFVPYFPYMLILYKNPKNITYVDTDAGLRIDNRIRIKYLINHDNNIEKIISYLNKPDKKISIFFRNKSNKLMINIMNIENEVESLSEKEYTLNTLKLYEKERNNVFMG